MTQDAFLKGPWSGTSLVVQWLGLHTGGMGSVPSQGTKIPYASLTQAEKIKIIKENKELVKRATIDIKTLVTLREVS